MGEEVRVGESGERKKREEARGGRGGGREMGGVGVGTGGRGTMVALSFHWMFGFVYVCARALA